MAAISRLTGRGHGLCGKKIVPEVGFVISIFVTGMMMIAKTMLNRGKRGSQNICGGSN